MAFKPFSAAKNGPVKSSSKGKTVKTPAAKSGSMPKKHDCGCGGSKK